MTDATEGTASYVRISDDKLGLELGVERQRKDTRALARRRDWGKPVEYADNDISASKGQHRPGYAALVSAIERGEVSRVVVWHQSRLWRNRRERAEGIELMKRHGVTLVCVKGPELDMSTAYGRGIADVVGAFDSIESDMISERVRRSIEQRAEHGQWHGGSRLYGYTIDRTTTIAAEATVMARSFEQFISGRPLGSVARDAECSPATMRARLRNMAYAGLRPYKGGEVTATWPAIVERSTWEAARSILADPSRTMNGGRGGRAARASLGAGLYRCGRCGHSVYSGWTGEAPSRPSYRCLSWLGGCGRTWHRPRVDAYVEAVVELRLASGEFADLLPVNRPDLEALRREATGIRQRLRKLGANYVRLGLDEDQVAEANRDGRARLGEIERAVERATPDPMLGQLLASGDPVQFWKDLPADDYGRRAAVVALVMKVILDAAPRGRLPSDWEESWTIYGDQCVRIEGPAS